MQCYGNSVKMHFELSVIVMEAMKQHILELLFFLFVKYIMIHDELFSHSSYAFYDTKVASKPSYTLFQMIDRVIPWLFEAFLHIRPKSFSRYAILLLWNANFCSFSVMSHSISTYNSHNIFHQARFTLYTDDTTILVHHH